MSAETKRPMCGLLQHMSLDTDLFQAETRIADLSTKVETLEAESADKTITLERTWKELKEAWKTINDMKVNLSRAVEALEFYANPMSKTYCEADYELKARNTLKDIRGER